jgi:uncharacterized delta-60 repeat protein
LALCAPALFGQTPAVSDGFDPNINGLVDAVVVQPNGQILVAGLFSTVWPAGYSGPVSRNNIARLNIDGTVDATFDPNANGQISALILQPDGRILIAGKFTAVQPNGTATATTRNRLARLNADGTLDPAFNPNVSAFYDPVTGGSLTPQVNTLALQTDGKIVIGGGFNRVGAATRNRIARLNADGSLDSAFDPNANNMVSALAIQRDGRILVGGGFTDITRNNNVDPNPTDTDNDHRTRNRLARLNADGTLDDNFDPNADNVVAAIAIHRDGRIVIGGSFTTLQPNGADTAILHNHLAGLLADGSADANFAPNASGNVAALAIQSDGRVLVGGYFTALQPNTVTSSTARGYVGRFNTDGSLDSDFNPNANYAVYAFGLQADGCIVLGGNFSTLQSSALSLPTTRNNIARVDATGALDKIFAPDASGRPGTVAVQTINAETKLLVAGNFTSISGVTLQGFGRLNANGSVDSTFNPQINGPVRAILVQADGKILIGGSFTMVGTTVRRNLARLNPADGSLDTAFDPSPDGSVSALVQQSDGKLILGGAFAVLTRHNNVDPNTTDTDTDRRVRDGIARINLDGTLDDNFDPNANAAVTAIKLQSDGKILIGGLFTTFSPNGSFSSSVRLHIARLNTDGSLDASFNPAPNDNVLAIALQSDGKIVMVGTFTTVSQHNGVDPNPSDTDNDRRPRNNIARVNADGTLDPGFDPNANRQILTVALQSNGKILIGGNFTTVQPNGASDWTLRKYFARLNTDGTADTSFDPFFNESVDSQVNGVLVQPDGNVIIVGGFTSLQPNGVGPSYQRMHIVRFGANDALDATYNPSATGQLINALAVQPDGKIIAGGQFDVYGGNTGTNLARFQADSTPDTQFTTKVEGPVNTILVLPAGEAVPTQSDGFAWLRNDGRLKPDFVSAIESRIIGQITAIALQSDGRVLVGGGFTTYNSAVGNNLVRFNADGSLDTTFAPNPDNYVQTIAVQQADGNILVGGSFTNIGGVAHSYIARLSSANGALDTTFDPLPDSQVSAIIEQPDHKILLVGNFTIFKPNGATAAIDRTFLARLNPDGTVDSGFNPGPNLQTVALALQADGKILIGGYFTLMKLGATTGGTTRNYIARINADGTLDTGFDPNANGIVSSIALHPAGVLLGGSFTTLQPNGAATATTRNYLARVKTDGTLDTGFDPNCSGAVNMIAVQADGEILIGGGFTSLRPNSATNGITRNHLARLNADGTLDTAFNPNANGTINVVVSGPAGTVLIGGTFGSLYPGGSILVGGAFPKVNGVALTNLALLNSDGTINTGFLPNPDDAVYALMTDPLGRIVVGGAFAGISGTGPARLARYTADNVLDATFAPVIGNGAVSALALQGDGRLLIGGTFTSVGGAAHNYLARLDASGTVDAFFNPSVSGAVGTLLVQSDGKILATVNTVGSGPAVNKLVRLNADGSNDTGFSNTAGGSVVSVALRTDGKIYAGGTFTTMGAASVSRLALLNASGAVDPAFASDANGAVTSLALQSDGKLLVGGGFTTIAGQPRQGLARLSTAVPAMDNITVSSDRTTITLERNGSNPQLSGVAFEQSADNRVWTGLGSATRVGSTGNWRVTTTSLPSQTYFYLRAREILPSTQGSSSGLAQIQREFYVRPLPSFSSPSVVSGTNGTGFFYASAASASPVSYSATGLPAGLTIDPATGIITGTPTQTGTFTATLSAVNDGGTGTLALTIIVSPAGPAPTDARFVNLSTSVFVDSASPVISGFVITGSEPRSVLLRAVGPGLSGIVSTPVLGNPRLDLYDNASGRLLLSNTGWGGSDLLLTLFARLGAFPLTKGSADAAAAITLPPGRYSIIVSNAGVNSTGGVVLAEIYDASGDPTRGAARLANISSRGFINAGNSVLTGGFVITGNTPKTVLIRGIGPALARFGVTGVLSDSIVSVFDNQGHFLAQNNNWETPVTISASYPAATSTQIAAAATTTGAFSLDAGSKDSSVLITLAPGVYSAQVVGASGATGATMVEIYELPAL